MGRERRCHAGFRCPVDSRSRHMPDRCTLGVMNKPPFRPTIRTQADLEKAWRHLMSPLGFSGYSIWMMVIEPNHRAGPPPHADRGRRTPARRQRGKRIRGLPPCRCRRCTGPRQPDGLPDQSARAATAPASATGPGRPGCTAPAGRPGCPAKRSISQPMTSSCRYPSMSSTRPHPPERRRSTPASATAVISRPAGPGVRRAPAGAGRAARPDHRQDRQGPPSRRPRRGARRWCLGRTPEDDPRARSSAR